MDLEELTLHYYLKVFNIILIIFLISFFVFFYYSINKKTLSKNILTIEKGETIDKILKKNFKQESTINILFYKIYYKKINFFYKKFIHYGDFSLENDVSFYEFINIVTKPGNILKKITIVEGWSNKELNLELKKHFEEFSTIPYEDIIADTYYFNQNTSFKTFLDHLILTKERYFKKYKNNKVFKLFQDLEIMTIGSLIEKEGLDLDDKRKISSVIINRLNQNMRLQIDASVIFAITNGKYNLQRELLLKDLKIQHPYNTYTNDGLPPKPISYVGKKTIDIIFENYKSDFLFYFYNKSLKRHIFSINYNDHKNKLNEYRTK